jgi:predicted helicase
LKLSQYLSDQGHSLKNNERLLIFLTNTLEPIEPQANFLLPAISAEVKAAQTVKDREILVIVGNPPYSGHSKNKGAWITAKINAYKQVDGKPLGEKNPKWLQDD